MSQELVNALIQILTPLVVLGATELVKIIFPKLKGLGTLLVVPALSLVLTLVTGLIPTGSTVPWWQQLLVGLAAVFVNEIKNALQPTTPTT